MATLKTRDDLLICVACGTQFDIPASSPPKGCRICDDPRQFIPPTGQTWTNLSAMRHGKTYHNVIQPEKFDPRMTSIFTSPKFAIGQRCILLETPGGNVLWDCITYLDQETVDFITSKGGLHAIVISHPHYYTTHLDWAKTFDCPVVVSEEDVEWVNRGDPDGRRKMIGTGRIEEEILGGGSGRRDVVKAIKVGGHFPGSLCLLWEEKLMVADTLVTTPSGLYHVDRPPGTNSYVFMWSIPNMIPLPPDVIHEMWKRLKPYDFTSTHGAFAGIDVRDQNVKARVLESMKIQVSSAGWKDVAILKETL
ncbi:uncharacterized protein MYCFIDRAFT_35041 [Pseudocercospora fijiensis CIRAD86]|uniref:Metallo-beta-lactamase domain-containing protein n=1 Tax=Pseudocercospora fijiensis (strain CIRAD86) TaxID=383855 RepID=M3AQU2_PSEFD|nr:uncharacterized protein MYCFIDRAFT_35041 [Pseudocercospora fijiensis CIRAD86]EME79468.1 hypothetical protein MYCFIDRAFT_35041 [Pseudocercospora fijiensis CIRAD86]